MRSTALLLTLALLAAACGTDDADPAATTPPTTAAAAGSPAPSAGELTGLAVELVLDGLETPVQAVSPPADDRLFIVEQPGRIQVVADGAPAAEPYLDISRFVEDEGLEQGLLGLAFHPDFAENGRLFVSFTNVDGDTRILEYRQDPADPMRADAASGRRILGIDQPHQYHNGGTIVFGPDGNLWIGIGDGGGIGDPYRNGQDPHTLMGAVLRIDVDGATPYAIPADNPFADGVAGAPEVWAFGLRNPWSLAFTDAGELVIAEVGQETWEEVIVASPDAGGANYGWPVVEGSDCYQTEPCDDAWFDEAALLVPHERTCAIVGGPVYRGAAIPELRGQYFYGDFCVGWVRSAAWQGDGFGPISEWSDQFGEVGQLTALSEDAAGEVLLLTTAGEVYRIVAERS